jgi:hypothetical protein
LVKLIDTNINLAVVLQKGYKSVKMAPPKKLPKTEEAAKEQGLSSMASFFSPKTKRGRPTKAASNDGRKNRN